VDKIEIFQVDAFTDKLFYGNPAAVCLLDCWLNDELMQAIAVENNLSETAFIIKEDEHFAIRWFTPNGEIKLCGHATLAAGFVLFECAGYKGHTVKFSSLSGPLYVYYHDQILTLDLPRLNFAPINASKAFIDLVDKPFDAIYESEFDYIMLFDHQLTAEKVIVNLPMLASLAKRGLIITAKGIQTDYYARCFYPKHNISEDPVTGSAHGVLVPFWTEKLGKSSLYALQGSKRQGTLIGEVIDNRVRMSGHCKLYSCGYLVI
tara:strand:- start:1375 stop:2160 length:786 start_codon:yes stop_codon:yes gene_type:complete